MLQMTALARRNPGERAPRVHSKPLTLWPHLGPLGQRKGSPGEERGAQVRVGPWREPPPLSLRGTASLNLGFLICGMVMDSLGDGDMWMRGLRGCTKQSPACGSAAVPAGDRGPESLARAGQQGAPRAHRPSRTAGGGAAEPQTGGGQRGGAGAPLPGARWPGQGLHLGRFLGLFSRAVKTLAALQVRVSWRGSFPPCSVQRPPSSSWAPKCLLQGFQTSAGRPPPPGRLTGLPQGSGWLLVPRVCGPLPALGCLGGWGLTSLPGLEPSIAAPEHPSLPRVVRSWGDTASPLRAQSRVRRKGSCCIPNPLACVPFGVCVCVCVSGPGRSRGGGVSAFVWEFVQPVGGVFVPVQLYMYL
ncbi:uncharacterized protein LOC116590069 [Mustela erminea]|uniref:uncharacterized protein LOC116590069 n=1 Tax=Mustela erminea TaxID=36723 RepID=UPI0013874A77|nr:uncharacterized protein LOC116590069 [Mustela erminea]